MRKAIAVSLAWLALVVAGCTPFYVAKKQQARDAAAVKGAPSFTVMPLQMKFRPPADWESPAEWAQHVAAWQQLFAEELESKVGSARIRWAKDGTPPAGLLVTVAVHEIIRGGSFAGGFDVLRSEVTITTPGAGEPLYTALVESNQQRYGMIEGNRGFTFGGRIGNAAVNLADAIAEAIATGHISD
jgi:hypothetical protein